MGELRIEELLKGKVVEGIKFLFDQSVSPNQITFQKTKQEFEGDITLLVFPLTKVSKKSPEETANKIGEYLKQNIPEVKSFNVVKGFLNLVVADEYWIKYLTSTINHQPSTISETVMVEFSSPNTNKPLHLGHIRNNLLGSSISNILKASGKKVVRVNLVNDRGIHICKSMLAWKKWGNGETPQSSGMKGDHLVGKYYVLFDQNLKSQVPSAKSQEEIQNAPLMKEVQELLRKWEAGDSETIALWKKMNGWVHDGFEKTYKDLGVEFEKTYYESETYLLGKKTVEEGLQKNIFYKKDDGSVWIDLTKDGLDEKLLLRSDGTSVYITQDLGTAIERQKEFHFDRKIYVVGNEQEYHFKVLFLVLKKLGYEWAENLFHLSYGMVDLPSGKMKSREGTVVDADDLIAEMIQTAKAKTQELGKADELSSEEAEKLYKMIGMSALKYFILKVDPKKRMLFNPEESIDFNGNTGPFIQYTYARIRSVLRKSQITNHKSQEIQNILPKEKNVIKLIHDYPKIISESAEQYNPGHVANYVFDLAKEFNQFYQEIPILKAEKEEEKNFRLLLSEKTSAVIKSSLELLGIAVPERM
ncbi:MAG: arginine--tRNA ligase [Bacteroidetes bacterium]|nr:arginine--tRNA ligase [Bacteroidota bacterium]